MMVRTWRMMLVKFLCYVHLRKQYSGRFVQDLMPTIAVVETSLLLSKSHGTSLSGTTLDGTAAGFISPRAMESQESESS